MLFDVLVGYKRSKRRIAQLRTGGQEAIAMSKNINSNTVARSLTFRFLGVFVMILALFCVGALPKRNRGLKTPSRYRSIH